MTRSLLQPIRTCRVRTFMARESDPTTTVPAMTPGTRKTLTAIGALWVSFATSAAAAPAASSPPASVNALASATDQAVRAPVIVENAGMCADWPTR